VENAVINGSITASGLETSSGKLLCKKLFFLPWMRHKLDDQTNLRHSIRVFFTAAIEHAVRTCKTSVAFPALGCGELNYDPTVIAELILDETERYANFNLKIFIVLLPNNQAAYHIFCRKLADLRARKPELNTTISYSHTSKSIREVYQM
jgi:O-acetyl-ADP-ribose deacetylase (regulator of RNase III)